MGMFDDLSKAPSSTRPDKLREKKNKAYHLKMAKYFTETKYLTDPKSTLSRLKSRVNWSFYKGNQWIFDEDLDPFLQDEAGNARNRIRWVNNIIKPIVKHYVGTSIRLEFSAKAQSVSRESLIRRKTAESNILGLQEELDRLPEFADKIKQNFPVEDTKEQTRELFNSRYVDRYEKGVNNVIKNVSRNNRFKEKKVRIAQHIALDGIAILAERLRNGEQVFEVIRPENFMFDISCKESDLSDSEYMGELYRKLPTQIFEENPDMKRWEMEAIEKLAISGNRTNYPDPIAKTVDDGRVGEYIVYWADIEKREYGFVIDELGDIIYTEINSDNSNYTDKDLIVPPDDEDAEELLNKDKKTIVYPDVIRFCKYVPGVSDDRSDGDAVVLDYGLFYETDKSSWSKHRLPFPYCVYTWDYHDGEVIAPVDDLISPQRFINRVLSMSESHVNNARGAGTIIDRSVIDEDDGEECIQRKMNLGKPVTVNAKRQVNNVIGQYTSGVDMKILSFYDLAMKMKDMAGSSIGMNDEVSGTAQGYRSSSSIAMSNLNQGSIMQEPVYFAVTQILLQAYEIIADRGLKYYSKNRRRFRTLVGNEIAESFILDPAFNSEMWDIQIVRGNSELDETTIANQMLINFLQLGLIDDKDFATAYNNSNQDDIGYILRESASRRAKAEQEKEKAAKVQADGASEMAAAQMEREDLNRAKEGIFSMAENEAQASFAGGENGQRS